MTDLAANAERVYADNYPGNVKDIEPKKHWWAHLLAAPAVRALQRDL